MLKKQKAAVSGDVKDCSWNMQESMQEGELGMG